MARENKTQYSVLGVLMEGSFSGYEIKKMINNSIGFFWSENFGNIYPVLRSLEKEGLVGKKKVIQDKKPVKNVFTITDRGKEHFIKWLNKPADYEKIRHELLLKIFFGNFSSNESNIEKLQVEVSFHKDLLERYSHLDIHIKNKHMTGIGPRYKLMTLDFGKLYSSTVIDWCNKTIDRLKNYKKEK